MQATSSSPDARRVLSDVLAEHTISGGTTPANTTARSAQSHPKELRASGCSRAVERSQDTACSGVSSPKAAHWHKCSTQKRYSAHKASNGSTDNEFCRSQSPPENASGLDSPCILSCSDFDQVSKATRASVREAQGKRSSEGESASRLSSEQAADFSRHHIGASTCDTGTLPAGGKGISAAKDVHNACDDIMIATQEAKSMEQREDETQAANENAIGLSNCKFHEEWLRS
jgi:hypothetical protein